MSDVISVAEWTQRNYSKIKKPFTHLRSFSSNSTDDLKSAPKPPRSILNQSNSMLTSHAMGENLDTLGNPLSKIRSSYYDEDGNLSTIPDPRSRAISPSSESPTLSAHHPDLNSEVATLSNKLIHAINHQTSLDDILSITRHELAAAQERSRYLERENQKHFELLSKGFLVKKSAMDALQVKMAASISEERRMRIEIEKEKQDIEQELENLTAALFEEANKMVVNAREEARKEVYATQKRNDQLKSQVADYESLLKSLQDQLAELKQVMEQMTEERDDQTNQTSPSSPGFSKSYSKGYQTDDTDITHLPPFHEPATPTHPTNLTHLLQTVLRTDLPSYHDFLSLLRMSKNNVGGKRASTGSYSGIGASLGLSNSTGSTTSCSTSSASNVASPATPNNSTSTGGSSSTIGHSSGSTLKDTRFYKRVLVEDIEPTLRLDSAPGLSWLARRTVMNAVCEGTLIVEPLPSSTKNFVQPCALCGESRNEPDYIRSHRFKTNENENAQMYPLCTYCVGRLRSTCDFLGFLRILKDGHWRCDDEESERNAWDESVRLREQMFWSRMGGGVVPVTPNHMSDPQRSPCAYRTSNELSWQLCNTSRSERDDQDDRNCCTKESHEASITRSGHKQSPVTSFSDKLGRTSTDTGRNLISSAIPYEFSSYEGMNTDEHKRFMISIPDKSD